MPITGPQNHQISLNDAAALTSRYRAQMGPRELKGGFFGLFGKCEEDCGRPVNGICKIEATRLRGYDDRISLSL